jgi:4-carboxymuconolactone decarboxylase
MQSDPGRRARGAQKIGEILGQTPEQVERSLGDVAPQLATYVLETIYGEIYQKPGAGLAHTADHCRGAGDARNRGAAVANPLRRGAAVANPLRCGVTRKETVEIMMQLVPYVGVAAAINGVAACREVFAAADKT